MAKFIYVFCPQDKDELQRLGYKLLRQNEAQNIYVFANSDDRKFEKLRLRWLETDMLTF